jgi:hypothetical protein
MNCNLFIPTVNETVTEPQKLSPSTYFCTVKCSSRPLLGSWHTLLRHPSPPAALLPGHTLPGSESGSVTVVLSGNAASLRCTLLMQ